MSTAVSNKENENEIFNELINAYKEKYGAYPLSVSQLLSHSTDTGKQLRYSFLKKSIPNMDQSKSKIRKDRITNDKNGTKQ